MARPGLPTMASTVAPINAGGVEPSVRARVLQRLQQQLQNAPQHNGTSSMKRATPRRRKKNAVQRDEDSYRGERTTRSTPRSHSRQQIARKSLTLAASTVAAPTSASTSVTESDGGRARSQPFPSGTNTHGSDDMSGTTGADDLECNIRGFDEDMHASAKEDIEDEFVAGAIRSGVALAFSSIPHHGTDDVRLPKASAVALNGHQEDVERDEMSKLVSALMIPSTAKSDASVAMTENATLSHVAVAPEGAVGVVPDNAGTTQTLAALQQQQQGAQADPIVSLTQTTEDTVPSTLPAVSQPAASMSDPESTHTKLAVAAAAEKNIVAPPSQGAAPLPESTAAATFPGGVENTVSLSSLLPLLGLGAPAQQTQQLYQAHQALFAEKTVLESRFRELVRALEQSDSLRRSCQQQLDHEVSENTKLRSALSLSTAETSRLSSRIASVEGEARRSAKVAEATLASAKQRCAKLADEGSQLKSQLTKSTIELGDALKANEELSSTCEELRLGVKNLEGAHALTRGELVSANATCRARAKEIEVLEERVRGLEMELGALREQLDASASLEAEVAELGSRVSRLVQEKGEQAVAVVRAEREAEEAGIALRGAGMELEAEKARASSLQQRIETMTTIEGDFRQEMNALEKALQESGRRERAAEEALVVMNNRFEDALQAQKIDRQAMTFDMDAKERCIQETEVALAEARIREKMLLKKIDALKGSRPMLDVGSSGDIGAASPSSSSQMQGVAQGAVLKGTASSGASLSSFVTKFDRELVARLETEEQVVIETLEKEQAAIDSLNQYRQSSPPTRKVGADGTSSIPSSLLVSPYSFGTGETPHSSMPQETVPDTGNSSLLDVFGFVPTS